MKKLIKLSAINFLIIIFLLLIIEITTRFVLHFNIGNSTAGLNERTQNLSYKPFVMFGPDWNRIFDEFETEKDYFTILIIGGSTAESFPEKIIEEEISGIIQKNVRVLNAANGGYNAIQELIVLSVWGSKTNPDLIISLDGANDLIHGLRNNEIGTFYLNPSYKLLLTKPYLSPFIWLLQNSQFYNSLVRLSARYKNFDSRNYDNVISNYINIQKNIKLFSKSLNADHIAILQPFHGFKNPLHDKEKAFKRYDYRKDIIKELYNETHIRLMKLYNSSDTYYINGIELFQEDPRWIFSDDVHFVDDVGYRVIARKISDIIINNKIK